MVDAAMMNPNPVEVPLGQFVQMNTVMWNCRGALNPDFKRRIYEMAVTTETIGYVGGLWVLWKKDEADIDLLVATK